MDLSVVLSSFWTFFITSLLEFCLSYVYVFAPAYTSLCRGMEYSLKERFIILVDLLQDGFLILETVKNFDLKTLGMSFESVPRAG